MLVVPVQCILSCVWRWHVTVCVKVKRQLCGVNSLLHLVFLDAHSGHRSGTANSFCPLNHPAKPYPQISIQIKEPPNKKFKAWTQTFLYWHCTHELERYLPPPCKTQAWEWDAQESEPQDNFASLALCELRSAEPVAASSLQGGWSDKHSTPLSVWGSQVSGKERGGLCILSGIVSSVCREYGLQQITSLTSTEKARRRMFADTISNSWRGILLHSPLLGFPESACLLQPYSRLSLFCFCLSPRNSFTYLTILNPLIYCMFISVWCVECLFISHSCI